MFLEVEATRQGAVSGLLLRGAVALMLVACCSAVAAGCGDDPATNPPGAGLAGTGGGTGGGAPGGGGSGPGGAGGSGGSGPVADPVVRLPRTSIRADELAVLVNANDEQSVAVAAYYQQQRQIPAENVITLSFGTSDVLSAGDFEAVQDELAAALPPEIQAFVLTWTTPYRVDCMSITSAFALGFDTKYCNTTGGQCGTTAFVDYYDSDSVRPFTDHGIRPTMMLAAAETAEAFALVDRGVAADDTFPTGDGYLLRTTDTARSVRWEIFVATLEDWDHDGGLALTYLDNSAGQGLNYIADEQDVLFYFTGLTTVPAIETLTYRPGAIADHLTSFGGKVPNSSQMSVVRWLEAGATASFGTVVEPCAFTHKFPNPKVLLPHYFRGQTLLEAYWKSVRWPGEGLFVGEPLARPWGESTVTYEGGTLTIETTMLDPERVYQLRGASAEQGPYEVVLDEISIDDYQLATITLTDVAVPYYELVEAGAE